MKALYLAGSIVFTVLILILAFENINAQCNGMMFFFYNIKSNPTIVSLGLALLGIITGALYHGFILKVMESGEEETDEF